VARSECAGGQLAPPKDALSPLLRGMRAERDAIRLTLQPTTVRFSSATSADAREFYGVTTDAESLVPPAVPYFA
jgi:hypothetical protein